MTIIALLVWLFPALYFLHPSTLVPLIAGAVYGVTISGTYEIGRLFHAGLMFSSALGSG